MLCWDSNPRIRRGEKKERAREMDDVKRDLIKQLRNHEIAIAELDSLRPSRSVYQKDGNIYFRTTIQKAKASEQKQVGLAKAKLERLNVP